LLLRRAKASYVALLADLQRGLFFFQVKLTELSRLILAKRRLRLLLGLSTKRKHLSVLGELKWMQM